MACVVQKLTKVEYGLCSVETNKIPRKPKRTVVIEFITRLKAIYLKLIQTHKRLKSTLFIRTKHNMRIFGVIPFIKLQ